MEIAPNLSAKFDAENAKGVLREEAQPKEIFKIRRKRGGKEGTTGHESLVATTQALTFSVHDPRSEGWTGDNPLIIQASIKNVVVHRVYIDTCNLADNIYEHCFRLLPDRWKEFLGPTTRRLAGFTGHSLWPLGTIHLPLTLTSDNQQRKKTVLVDFVVIRHSAKHNIILGRTALLKIGVVPSTMHGIVKFSTIKGPNTTLATPPKQLQCFTIMQPTEITRETKKSWGGSDGF